MKVLLFILTFVYSNPFVSVHDAPMATFYIFESDDSMQIDITFDLEDLQTSLGIKTNDVNLEYVQNYLDQNTSFEFNTQVANLTISKVKIVRDHIKVKGSFGKFAEEIATIKIENDCLINVSHHSNVIQIDLNDKSRDFRMNKNRTEINLEY